MQCCPSSPRSVQASRHVLIMPCRKPSPNRGMQSRPAVRAGGPSRFPNATLCPWGRYLGRFNGVRTLWIADSIGGMGRKGEMVEMWLGTRSKRANFPATRRERRLLLTCCDNQRRTRLQPRLAQEERKLQARLQSKQSGSS
jgi:hypothetical protein